MSSDNSGTTERSPRIDASARAVSDVPGGRSLLDRLLGWLGVGTLGACVLTLAGLWWTGGQLVEDSLRKQAAQWLAELDQQGTPLYLSARPEPVMREIGARLAKHPEIAYVLYYDAKGEHLLGEYLKAGRERPALLAPKDVEAAGAVATEDTPFLVQGVGHRVGIVRVTAPVRIRTLPAAGLRNLEQGARAEAVRVIGYIDFGLDPGHERAAFLKSLIAGSVALAAVFLLALFIGRHMIRKALAPLIALQEPLARLARGDMEVQMGDGGDREIAAIREALSATIGLLRQREQALRRAECDALTGLANRRYLARQLELERGRLGREGGAHAVLHIDLDHFKRINDALGHGAGDRLLGQIAGILRAHIRGNDLLARVGGDEFVALVRKVNREGAIKVARSINQVIQDFQFVEHEKSFAIAASIGIAVLDGKRAIEQTLDQAQTACDQAKARGGNRYWIDEPDETQGGDRRHEPEWSDQLAGAIRDNALKLVAQPIVSLDQASGERYELLLRLAGADGELMAPAAFLPLANRFGMLLELDHWVIRQACAMYAGLRATGREATFFVNLSGQAFDDGEALLRVVGDNLKQQRVPGVALVFEITEQVAVRHVEQARRVIEDLGRLGCRFALDDFGSGFSSLNYLKHLPVSFIKISGAFVEKAAADTLDQLMVRSIVQIARALGKQTIAESVEDRRTFQLLSDIGADFAQGYFIARPAEALPDPGFFRSDRLRRLRDVRPLALLGSRSGEEPGRG